MGKDKNFLDKYPDMLTAKHLVEIFGVSKNTIYKQIKLGKFGTPISMGRELKVPKLYIWEKFFVNYN